MHGDVALREFPPSDEVLTGRQRLELRRHEAHRRKWSVTPHEDVFWYPIQNFWISLVIKEHPCLRSATFSLSSCVRPSSGHSIRWATVSLRPQFGQLSSGESSPDYHPTCTLEPQSPECCFGLQILYISFLFLRARSKCSQSTESKRSVDHLFLGRDAKYFLATSLLA